MNKKYIALNSGIQISKKESLIVINEEQEDSSISG